MPRLFHSSKGQWFVISAVIASGIFLAISFLLKDYFPVRETGNMESIYLDDIRNGSIRAIQMDCARGGFTEKTNLTEYIHFATREMSAMGYILNVTPKTAIDCSKGMENFYVIIVKSAKADVWDGVRPEISGIGNIMFSGGTLSSFGVRFKAVMPYPFSMNASIYDNAGALVNSVVWYVPGSVEYAPGEVETAVSFAGLDIPQARADYAVINSVHLTGKKRWELF